MIAGLLGRRLMIGVDRLDYSKGLVERFKAYERFLETHPENQNRVTFLQIAPLSRTDVRAYAEIRRELEQTTGRTNGRFADTDWTPIRYLNRNFPHDVLMGFMRSALIGIVTPVRDGMNLVAKEFVAAQDPADPGVLILSTMAGAARELTTRGHGESLRLARHGARDPAGVQHAARRTARTPPGDARGAASAIPSPRGTRASSTRSNRWPARPSWRSRRLSSGLRARLSGRRASRLRSPRVARPRRMYGLRFITVQISSLRWFSIIEMIGALVDAQVVAGHPADAADALAVLERHVVVEARVERIDEAVLAVDVAAVALSCISRAAGIDDLGRERQRGDGSGRRDRAVVDDSR